MADKLCPLLKKSCVEHTCRWYVHLIGSSPQTDKPIDEWGCAVEWLPVLLIENAKETRQAAAAIESARNENVNGLRAIAVALPRMEKQVDPVSTQRQLKE